MYLSHFGLEKSPFEPLPDPRLFYPGSTHLDALRTILRSIELRLGLIWLSGRPGLGKTTIMNLVVDRLDKEKVRVISITNPEVSYRGLLEAIYTSLGVRPPESPGLIDVGHQLYRVLQQEYDQGRNVALMIDDVQRMPIRTLTSVLRLKNLQENGQPLIQVVLAGREPEVSTILKGDRFKQLGQEPFFQVVLAPLTRDESIEYIQFRVSAVMGGQHFPFTQTALKQIVDHCGGNPRNLNLFCERTLEAGWRREENPVGVTTVQDVVAGLLSIDSEEARTTPRGSVGVAVALMALLWLITLGLTFFREGGPGVGEPETVEHLTVSREIPGDQASPWGGGAVGDRSSVAGGRTSPGNAALTASKLSATPADRGGAGSLRKGAFPRIERLPGGIESEIFWVYGPRDLAETGDVDISQSNQEVVHDKKPMK